MEIFKWHLACAGPLSPNSLRGEAFLSTVYARTEGTFDLDSFTDEVRRAYKETHSTRPSRSLMPKWPDIELTRESIDHYANQNLYSVFPAVEPSRLRTLIEEYTSNSLDERKKTVARALLVAFTAFMTQIHRHLPAFAEAEPDCYIVASLSLLPHLILEPRSIEALQAVMIMVRHQPPLQDLVSNTTDYHRPST